MNRANEHSSGTAGAGKSRVLPRGSGGAGKIITVARVAMSATFLSAWAVLMLVVALVTLFRARRLYNEYLAKWLARGMLKIWGVEVVTHGRERLPADRQVVYISNHSSTIDMFAIISLGLVRCRYFLRKGLKIIVPLGIIATIMGTFFTYPQTQPAKRAELFRRADRTLRKTGESVYLSPEGKRVTTGEIGHFNKGAFHLATSLKVPIVPFYIFIPKDIDPGRGLVARPGTVHIYFDEPVDTRDWQLENLVDNKEKVRQRFLQLQRRYAGSTNGPGESSAAARRSE